jgi:hypothetical protein
MVSCYEWFIGVPHRANHFPQAYSIGRRMSNIKTLGSDTESELAFDRERGCQPTE